MGFVLQPPPPVRREVVNATLIAIAGLLVLLVSSRLAAGQCVGPNCPPRVQSPKQTPPPAIVRIYAEEADGSGGYGSGSLVMTEGIRSYVLTAAHVIRDAASIVVFSPDGQSWSAIPVAVDEANDVALIQTAAMPQRPLAVASTPIKGSLTIAGYGDGSYRSSTGLILAQNQRPGSKDLGLSIGTPARQGDSGGPVLDAQGRVVGVVWANGQSGAYITAMGPVRRLLARVRSWFRPGVAVVVPKQPNTQPARPPAAARDGLIPQPTAPPAACDCAGQRAAINDRLNALEANPGVSPAQFDQLATATNQARSDASAAREESQSILGRVTGIAKDKAAEVAGERIRQFDLQEKLSAGGMALAGALGLGGPMALAFTWFAGRIGKRLERRIDERLGGREVRDPDSFRGVRQAA
ncbi:MAG: serine protease [Planctomycetota bacterium]